MRPHVSIVIPTHTERRWESFRRTVASAQRQTHPAAEIVAAVDHHPALATRIRRELPEIKVCENAYDRGVSGTRNTGAAHTRTPLIAFLDDDTVAAPTWLARLIEPFADPAVVGTGGGILPAWEGPRPRWWPDELLWAVGVSYAGMPTETARIRNVWSAGMAVRRDAFDLVGGFRTGFGKLGDRNRPEDTELCLRMSAETGGSWMYVPGAVIDHEVPASRSTFTFLMRRCYHEGRGKVQMATLLATSPPTRAPSSLPSAAPSSPVSPSPASPSPASPRPSSLSGAAARSAADEALSTETDYLRRTLPRAVVRNLIDASRGRGAVHALRAGTVIAAVAAAGLGGGVEAVSTLF
ncbi:glycosyltransferase family 2 protein [Actinoplanes sp. NPDC051851]|uniref:glycosyltransferase family 2 protein n=1 Tax=Actinoplanes sp. NPDC051851 TaxID=3154753 RepID=UPI003429E9FD